MKKSSLIQIVVGIVISSVGIYIFLKNVNLLEIWNQIKTTEWWIVIAVAALSPLSIWFRSVRWKIILPEKNDGMKSGLFSIVMISFMINNIFPARLGEAARALILWRKNKFTVAESIGSLVLERIFDSISFLSFLFVPIFFVNGLEHLYLYGVICLSVFLITICGLFLYAIFPSFTKKKAQGALKIFPGKIQSKAGKFGSELISNLDWIFSFTKVIKVIVLSYLILFCYAGMIWLLGFKIETFGFLDSMFGVAFAALGAAIPLSPGYVGTLHAMLLEGLKLLGVSIEKAGAIAVLYHAIGYIIVTVLGIYFFFVSNISFKEIGNAKEEMKR